MWGPSPHGERLREAKGAGRGATLDRPRGHPRSPSASRKSWLEPTYAYGVACQARRTVARVIKRSSRSAASRIAPSATASSTRGTPAASS